MTTPEVYEFPAAVTPQATLTATVYRLQVRTCSLYPSHRSPILEKHHIAPQSWWKAAGIPIGTPLAEICGLCHNNTHAALDALIRGTGLGDLARKPIALARQGLAIAAEHGLEPRPTL